MPDKFTNGLVNETSPYLLQHAHNPVNWFAWGANALTKAKAENKVILVSIGYSACHWCHVMERESFENEEVASIMNEHFINIKIDREERPDLDHIYMDAVQAISGSGGWPLNVFLTPDAKPFFGGTYFPPVKAFNRPSWTEILMGVSQSWKQKENEIIAQAENLTSHLQKANSFQFGDNTGVVIGGEKIVADEQIGLMFSGIMTSADKEWGGFGTAPKFPQTFTIQFLLQYHYFTGNGDALNQALISIDKMIDGGIYDHVAGGLARYSTDVEWLAPHFEKMLYDNALLINVLCDAWQITSNDKYRQAIHKTISFVSHELTNHEGCFYAALDADSEGEEGKYYVWQKAEIEEILEADSVIFCAFFDITEQGNWDGKNILRILRQSDDFVKTMSLDKDQFEQMIGFCLKKLRLYREKQRTKPSLDDKIILSWNALMLRAVAKASVVLQHDRYRNIAEASLDTLMKYFRIEDAGIALMHTYKDGTAKYPAFLDDYANLVAAFIQLYKATFKDKYLYLAYDYCKYIIDNFSDEDSVLFFFTHVTQKDVIVRKKEIYDGATPSGNAIMAENLFQLSVIFEREDWKSRAQWMLKSLSPLIVKYPGSFGIWASLLLQQQIGVNEIAVVGNDYLAVADNIMLNFVPNTILMGSVAQNQRFPLLSNKPESNATLIYLCKNYTCLEPYLQPDLLIKEINKSNKLTV